MSAPDRTNGHGSSSSEGGHHRGFDGPIAPPQNLEAEQSVLGAVLLSDTALPALIIDERLHPADFYRDGHGRIYQAMLDLHTLGEPVDALTLVEHLKQAGDLESVGGRAAIDLLAGSVPAVGNVRQYARIVRDNAMLRRLLRASYEIQARVHSHEALPRDLVDMAERAILEVAQEDSRKDFRAIHDLLESELNKLERLSREGKAITGTASGFDDLDSITGGFQGGNLIILAARPSMGKCLAGSALVYDPRTGARRRIDELVAAIEAGKDAYVAAAGPDLKLRSARASAGLRSGRQPAFRLKTRLGRAITATANHPLLTFDGWQELRDIDPGHAHRCAPATPTLVLEHEPARSRDRASGCPDRGRQPDPAYAALLLRRGLTRAPGSRTGSCGDGPTRVDADRRDRVYQRRPGQGPQSAHRAVPPAWPLGEEVRGQVCARLDLRPRRRADRPIPLGALRLRRPRVRLGAIQPDRLHDHQRAPRPRRPAPPPAPRHHRLHPPAAQGGLRGNGRCGARGPDHRARRSGHLRQDASLWSASRTASRR